MQSMVLAQLGLVCAALQGGLVEGPPVAVEPVRLEQAGIHLASGQQIRLAIRFYGAQGRELDLRARPYQLAHSLAAPVGAPIEVAAGVALGDEAWHDFSLSLDCPAVNQVTTWELRFEHRTAREDAWRAAGATRLELYPPDLLQPVRQLATAQPWFVSDASGKLKQLLTGHGIPFRDLDSPAGREAFERAQRGSTVRRQAGLDEPVSSGGSLVLRVLEQDAPVRPGARTPDAQLAKARRVLVFARPSDVLPHTTLRLEPHRTSVTVDVQLLASMAHDPRAQLAFAEAVRMTQLDLDGGSSQ